MKPATNHHGIAIIIAMLSLTNCFSQTTIFSATGVSWKYLNNGTNPGLTWKDSTFNDLAWTNANTEFGYPSGFTTNLAANPITTYFRKKFTVTGLSSIQSFTLNYHRNDGVLIYINGVEINSTSRDNMPAGAVNNLTSAVARLNNGQTNTEQTISNISSSLFVEGDNWIAVEVHQFNSVQGLGDMRFRMELLAIPIPPVTIDRGPYIMMVNETAATFRWRTTVESNSRVQLGTSPGVYTIVVDDAIDTNQHIVRVTGLIPDTKYYYSVGTTSNPVLGGNASDYYFTTAAPANTTRKLKFAVFGDCGRNDNSFRTQSISSYLNYVGSNTADALLLLGDNAYTNGTEAEYNAGFFTPMSSTMLKNHPLFPAPGNHDYYGTSQSLRTGEYYQAFSIPVNAECGGVASGAKGYYSWNWGDVHFLSLDSYGTETGSNLRLYDTLGPQVTWIKNDLAANTRKWVIAYWHHPPYTMGSHTSNSETELVNIRYNFIRILERMGVDMILCGHSHDYERSKLLNGHYGTEVSTAAMAPYLVSNSSGRYDGSLSSCPYTTSSNTANHGTVYVVAGSSGADGGVNAGIDGYPHNALPYSIDDGGMLYFEVEANRLDAKFLRRDNSVADQFTILKDVNQSPTYNITSGNSINLTASWPGSYSWSTSASTRTIAVTPPLGTSNYTVTDQYGCITDQFTVIANATLPVMLKDYRVSLQQQKVFVDWISAAEQNNLQYRIERSKDARVFELVGIVNGSGNSSTDIAYQFIDPQPLDNTSFYRLSQVDIDGTEKYFDIKKIINHRDNDFYADAYVTGANMVQMHLYSDKAAQLHWRAIGMNGQVIKTGDWSLTTGSNSRNLELNRGSYILEWKRSDGRQLTQKIIIP